MKKSQCCNFSSSGFLRRRSMLPLSLGHINIVTARVRSTREGTVFTGVCLITFQGGGGYPIQIWMVGGGVPHPDLDGGGTPSQVWEWGGTYPGLDGWGYPSQVWMVGGTLARS